MDLGLNGKNALVIGGGGGIGSAVVLTLAEEGVNSVVADIREDAAKKVAEEACDKGVKAFPFRSDVSDLSQAQAMFDFAISQFGKVDILINCAGYWGSGTFGREQIHSSYEPPVGPSSADFAEVWKRETEVCYWGVINSCKAAFQHFKERNGGKIVNISSDTGRGGMTTQPIYSAAKAGVNAITKSLARELAPQRVNVNAVSPGTVKTTPILRTLSKTEGLEERIASAYPLGRLGEPQDIANMVVFLCSDRCSWVTGQVISVNGGVFI